MDGSERQDKPTGNEDAASTAHSDSPPSSEPGAHSGEVPNDSLFEELGDLIDDGRNYAQAELAFQKTRAKLAGRSVGIAAAAVVVALILLNIAFLALAVGLVIALEPLVTIWGAIAIVVGVLLLFVVGLLLLALSNVKLLSALFEKASD